MPEIRWGIVGCGDVCEVKSGPGLYKAEDSALVAVMRRNGELAADYARRHAVPRWYDDGDRLINDPEVNAVYIATPPDTHMEYTLKAAQAGKPVYVEKPMARTFDECQAMIRACEAAGVPLWVAYYRRRLPKFLKVQELLEQGAIGDVRSVLIRYYQGAKAFATASAAHLQKPEQGPTDAFPDQRSWRVDPEIAGAGLFLDLGSHMLDILDYLLGPISRVEGFAANQGGHYDAEDIVCGSFTFESGVQGTGTWMFTGFENLDWTEIEGTEGRIGYVCFDASPIVLTTSAGVQEIPITQPDHVHQPLIQTIVDELNGRGRCPSTGVSGARTSWVMDQMLAEYRQKNYG